MLNSKNNFQINALQSAMPFSSLINSLQNFIIYHINPYTILYYAFIIKMVISIYLMTKNIYLFDDASILFHHIIDPNVVEELKALEESLRDDITRQHQCKTELLNLTHEGYNLSNKGLLQGGLSDSEQARYTSINQAIEAKARELAEKTNIVEARVETIKRLNPNFRFRDYRPSFINRNY